MKSCFLSEALLVELLGASGASIKSVLLHLWKDFIQKVSRFPKLPSLYRPSQFNLSSLNGSLESISGPQECHYLTVTPPSPEPLPMAQGSLKWFLLRENPLSAASCEKIKDVWLLFSTVQWKVEKRAGKSRRMSFIRIFGVPLWMAEGCRRARVKDNIGLNPKKKYLHWDEGKMDVVTSKKKTYLTACFKMKTLTRCAAKASYWRNKTDAFSSMMLPITMTSNAPAGLRESNLCVLVRHVTFKACFQWADVGWH